MALHIEKAVEQNREEIEQIKADGEAEKTKLILDEKQKMLEAQDNARAEKKQQEDLEAQQTAEAIERTK